MIEELPKRKCVSYDRHMQNTMKLDMYVLSFIYDYGHPPLVIKYDVEHYKKIL